MVLFVIIVSENLMKKMITSNKIRHNASKCQKNCYCVNLEGVEIE